jgi:hypothetical protein
LDERLQLERGGRTEEQFRHGAKRAHFRLLNPRQDLQSALYGADLGSMILVVLRRCGRLSETSAPRPGIVVHGRLGEPSLPVCRGGTLT